MKYSLTIEFEGPEEGVVPVEEGDPFELEVIERKVRDLLASEMKRLNEQHRRAEMAKLPDVYYAETLAAKKAAEEAAQK